MLFPNCPFALLPQVYKTPSLVIKALLIVFPEPLLLAITFRNGVSPSSSNTFVKVLIGDVLLPKPNCPEVLSPALYTSPVLLMAKEVAFPALTLTIFSRSTNSSFSFLVCATTKILLAVAFPVASCPEVFNPTVYTLPSSFRKILWFAPAPIS